MLKKMLAILGAGVMLLSLAACTAGQNPPGTEPTPTETPTEPADTPVISQVKWLVDCIPFEVNCQYDALTHTLNISGDSCYPMEVLFDEESYQVKKKTVRDEEGEIFLLQEYDEQGNLIYEQDENGDQKYFEYAGKLLLQETVCQDSELLYVKEWSYDDAGRETSYSEEATDGSESQTISQTYDEDGHLIEYRLDSTYEDEHWYQHDTYTYQDGLLVSSSHDGDDPANAWDYSMTYRHDGQGRTVSALRHDDTYGTVEDLWDYDDAGRLIRTVEHYQMDGWAESVTEYRYDDAGRLVWEAFTERMLPDGDVYCQDETRYTYNDSGLLTEKLYTNTYDEEPYVQRYDYDGQGNRTLHSFGPEGEEDVLTFDYDSSGHLIRLNLNGNEILRGADILLQSGEDLADRYIAAKYENMAGATEAAAVNAFILSYIQE